MAPGDQSAAVVTRWSGAGDEAALARIHEAAWRYAYSGVIPGPALTRMIAWRGPRYWRRVHAKGARALVIALGGAPMGYALIGPSRTRRLAGHGEIYELYLDPVCHGCGLGRRLFGAARAALAEHGRTRLLVWSVADNALGGRFYTALGGRPAMRRESALGGARLAQIGFVWN